jgi:hypothetical protein
MGRKSSNKAQARPASSTPPPSDPRRSFTPLLAVAIAAIAIAGGIVYSLSGSEPAPPMAAQTAAAPPVQTVVDPPPSAAFGPRSQANLPPVPLEYGPPARPAEVVRAVYKFSAEHPEVLAYVPCYCGCEREGHRGNDDCFVKKRNASGDVTEWEPHGVT